MKASVYLCCLLMLGIAINGSSTGVSPDVEVDCHSIEMAITQSDTAFTFTNEQAPVVMHQELNRHALEGFADEPFNKREAFLRYPAIAIPAKEGPPLTQVTPGKANTISTSYEGLNGLTAYESQPESWRPTQLLVSQFTNRFDHLSVRVDSGDC